MSTRRSGIAVVLATLASACASSPTPSPATQLQMRQIQTRVYEVDDQRLALKAVVSTLLDDGYLIEESDTELGLVTASLSTSSRSFWDKMVSVATYGMQGSGKLKVVEVTVNVEAYGTSTRVRLSSRLVEKSGDTTRVEPIDDPEYYQAFFAKLDKSLFLLMEKL